jgi:hypothetical protein
MKSKPFASVALGMLPSGGASQQIRNWTGAREEPQSLATCGSFSDLSRLFFGRAGVAEAVMNKCHREMIKLDAR